NDARNCLASTEYRQYNENAEEPPIDTSWLASRRKHLKHGCPASAPMRQIGRVEEGSDCLFRQAASGCHGRRSRRIALRIVISLRATATRARSLGLPAATSLSR